MVIKKYLYKVYKNDGTFITTLNDVVSDPSFTFNINGSIGDMTIKLLRKFDSFGEEEDITLNNEIRIICVDNDEPEGVIIYSGYISGYRPVLDEGNEYIEITLLPYVTTLENEILNDDGVTLVEYLSQDPNDIMTDIISKYTGRVSKASDSNVGILISYSFNTSTYLQAIKKCRDLSLSGWHWYIDALNILHFKKKSEVANHILKISKDILSIKPEKRIENVKNVILFVGDGIYKKYERSGSTDSYGRRVSVMQDSRVSVVSTADIMAEAFLDDNELPEVRTYLKVADNNIDSKFGYDIESFRPGEMVQIKEFGNLYPETLWDISTWDETYWDYSISYAVKNPMQIVSIKYTPNYCELELSSRPISVENRIEDINRNFESYINNNNPATPS